MAVTIIRGEKPWVWERAEEGEDGGVAWLVMWCADRSRINSSCNKVIIIKHP